jgi:hypothetical protein
MPVIISLLRGINVGGHNQVKMDALRAGLRICRWQCAENGLGPVGSLSLRHPPDKAWHHRVFKGAEFGEEMMELEDKPDMPVAHLGQLSVRPLAKILSLKENLPLRRTVQSPQNMQEGTLAGPGNSFDGQHLSRKDGQVDPLENFDDFTGATKDEGFFQPFGFIEGNIPRSCG